MSSLWTPDGERPVARPSSPAGGAPPGAEDEPVDDEALAAEVEAMRAQLAGAPVEEVLANHCYGLFELAAVYLSQQPPLLPQARVAIDALGCLVTGMEGRLGENESALADGLTQPPDGLGPDRRRPACRGLGRRRGRARTPSAAGGATDVPDDAGDG